MTLADQLDAELSRHTPFSGPGCVSAALAGPDGMTFQIELSAIDRVGCSVETLQATVPKLANAGPQIIKEWGEQLCRRISYLLESLGVLEIDEQQGELLIRSQPPERVGNTTSYYEVLLQPLSGGRFLLNRYEVVQGGSRTRVDMHLTQQVLKRLVRDLAETVPATP